MANTQSTTEPLLDPGILRLMLGILLMSIALHVVPQALSPYFKPEHTMLLFMILDALLIALLARRWSLVRAAVILIAVLALTVTLRQQAFAALPSIVMNLSLAILFGATLRRGSVPLLLRISAAAFPQDMSPVFERYMRTLTAVWATFFVIMALTSVVLMGFTSFTTWSLFVNVLSWPITALLFLGECLLRRLALPHLPAHTPTQILVGMFTYGGRVLSVAPSRSP